MSLDFSKKEDFKVGDWVKRKESEIDYCWREYCDKYGCGYYDTFEIIGFDVSDSDVLLLNMNGHKERWDIMNFILGKKGKKVKVKPIELHLLMENDCNNVVKVVNSFNEAVIKSKESNNKQTIYELVKVADVESVRKVTKVRKVRKKK